MKFTLEVGLVIIVTVLVVVILCMTYNRNKSKEQFINRRAFGVSFGEYYNPNPNPNPHPPLKCNNSRPNPNACTPENNCFPGMQLRSQVYQNLCNDPSSGINKLPVQLGDTCLRTHNPQSAPHLMNLQCGKNRDGQINCTY